MLVKLAKKSIIIKKDTQIEESDIFQLGKLSLLFLVLFGPGFHDRPQQFEIIEPLVGYHNTHNDQERHESGEHEQGKTTQH